MSRLVEKIHSPEISETDSRMDNSFALSEHTDAPCSECTESETSVDTCQNVLHQNNGESKELNDSPHGIEINDERKPGSVEKDNDNRTINKGRDKQKKDKQEEVIESFTLENLQKLIVKNKNGDDVLFCDTGVYTKNRNFRMFLSSKLGKKNPLVLAPQNEYYSKGDSQMSKLENIFYDSLVANVEYCSSMRILTYESENMSGNLIGVSGRKREKPSQDAECIDGYSRSPYPEVDEYITSIITMNSGKGVIRHWTYFHQGELLVYEIAKYRFCHNIGRYHRSNNIM